MTTISVARRPDLPGALRMLRIEIRRNVALFLFPVIVAIAWLLLRGQWWEPLLWESTNQLLHQAVLLFTLPAMSGAAAWMAGRSRRRGMEELLATTPLPDTRRHLTVLAATTVWGLLAYAVFAAYMMGRTTLGATWGGPHLWPVMFVIAAILAHIGWGFACGILVPSRFTTPLVAVGAFGVQQVVANIKQSMPDGGSMPTWATHLSAHDQYSTPTASRALFYAALTCAALAVIALRNQRSISRWTALIGSVALTIVGVAMVWGESPRSPMGSMVSYDNWGRELHYEEQRPAPVCKGAPVAVCVHPQYQPWLDETVAAANEFMKPLLGLPGVPMRLEQGIGGLMTGSGEERSRLAIGGVVDELVMDPSAIRNGASMNEAQLAIRTWLQGRLGEDHGCYDGMPEEHDSPGTESRRTCDAGARFARLTAAEQRAWLEKHYADLRAGKLTLEDLP